MVLGGWAGLIGKIKGTKQGIGIIFTYKLSKIHRFSMRIKNIFTYPGFA
jgi:hypothetical protein